MGTDIYEKLIKGYTLKQWGRPCTELPSFIIQRLPVRLTFDNNYFNALYQGIPMGGYTRLVENLLKKRWIIMLALALLLLAACGGKQEPAQTESPAKPKTVAPLAPDLSLEDLEDCTFAVALSVFS